ncbi:MAG: class II aldolase/adducin family protein [Pseudomonadota bacterium]
MSELKINLANAYRILAHLKMDDHTYTHLSCRAENGDSFYIYPFGLTFSEVTKDNLLKVSFSGELIEGSEYQYNETGYIIHSNIYQNRPDINAIFHLHTPASVAVSAMKRGLMPISQWALHFYKKVAYHNYNSLALDWGVHGNDLVNDLKNYFVMLLHNHGMITCGKTIHEAMFYAYHMEMACKTQCLALGSGEELVLPSEAICQKAVKDLLTFEKDLGKRDWQAWIRKLMLG